MEPFYLEGKQNLQKIIKKCKEDPTFGILFHETLTTIIMPVYKSIAGQNSNCVEYEIMRKECVNDILMFVLTHENIEYTNFKSYIRKRFEFYFLNKLITYNRLKERYALNFDDVENRPNIGLSGNGDDKTYFDESFNEIFKFMNAKVKIFDFQEKIIVTYFTNGFNFNEISDLLGCSYGKTKNTFGSIITKLKNFYFKTLEETKK